MRISLTCSESYGKPAPPFWWWAFSLARRVGRGTSISDYQWGQRGFKKSALFTWSVYVQKPVLLSHYHVTQAHVHEKDSATVPTRFHPAL